MLLTLPSGAEFFLDGLVLETILLHLRAAELARLCATSPALAMPALAAAHRKLIELLGSIQCTTLRELERGSWIFQLAEWEDVVADNIVWLQAERSATSLRSKVRGPMCGEKGCCGHGAHDIIISPQDGKLLVNACVDLSGSGHSAKMHHRPPVFVPDCINGCAAFEFDGTSVLKTVPFAEPLPQPITLIVVARAQGDTTIIDALGPSSSRFELCHGYPSGWHPSPEICMTASGHDAAPKHSLRGSTRGTGDWHIYTAVFNMRRSEIYIDGRCEATGKNVGSNSLDGLSIGCDHNGIFFLIGAIAEVRLFKSNLPMAQRVQIEASLAKRYGLPYSIARDVPTPVRSRASSMNCNTWGTSRVSLRTALSEL